MAAALGGGGEQVVVPNLVAAARTGDPQQFVSAAVSAAGTDDEVVIVGHSGAGSLLPLIAKGLSARSRLMVFVDAVVPPCEGIVCIGGHFLEDLGELASDGLLPPWSRWWGGGVLEALVPLEDRRLEVETELPTIPLAFYEASIEMPSGWCTTPAAYLLLSDAYRDDARTASALGWSVVERPGAHLDIVTQEAAIASILRDLAPDAPAAGS